MYSTSHVGHKGTGYTRVCLSLIWMYGTTLLHDVLAITLAALGAIFHVSPALCPCDPRPPRGEMHAAPCGGRSDTRLLGLSLAAS